jgi:hypothetical protein
MYSFFKIKFTNRKKQVSNKVIQNLAHIKKVFIAAVKQSIEFLQQIKFILVICTVYSPMIFLSAVILRHVNLVFTRE